MSGPAAISSPLLPVTWQRRGEFRLVLIVIGSCCWVALWSWIQNRGSLQDALVTSNAMGLSILLVMTVVRLLSRGRLPAWGVAIGIPLGAAIGSRVAHFVGGTDIVSLMVSNPQPLRNMILSQIFIGITVMGFFLYLGHSRSVKEDLERERRRAAEALHAQTVSRLALLQAQIEPHFLFNTLANVQSLIAQDPEGASQVLEHLNTYLISSLRRSREMTSTVGEELDLVEALLAIASLRLGSRFDYTIAASPNARAASFPPLLFQPLVENAIRHGIEPAVDGGKIHVEVHRGPDGLELTVSDTGVGLNPNAPEGVGLSNVRARLASLFAGKGKLALFDNTPRGVIAKLSLPEGHPDTSRASA